MKAPILVALAVLVAVVSVDPLVWAAGEVAADVKAAKTAKAEQVEEKKEPSVWMKIKMNGTAGILTGLASGDFDTIKEHATRMYAFSRIEKLTKGKNEEYQLQLKMFRYANRKLIQMASAKNLEGATLAFNQMTTSCVNCHRVIRDDQPGASSLKALR